jgi:hypothetical protein
MGSVPYVRCPRCGNAAYSAAFRSGRDSCPFCGGLLRVQRGSRVEDTRVGSSDQRKELQRVDDAAPPTQRVAE